MNVGELVKRLAEQAGNYQLLEDILTDETEVIVSPCPECPAVEAEPINSVRFSEEAKAVVIYTE